MKILPRFAVLALLTALFAACVIAAEVAPADRDRATAAIPKSSVRFIQTSHSIVVGLDNFDLLRRRFKDLAGEFVLQDADGNTINSCRFDYTTPIARSHLVFLKKANVRYESVAVVLKDADATLLDATCALPKPVEAKVTAALTNEKAYLVLGSRAGEHRIPDEIVLPDLARAPTPRLETPARSINLKNCLRPVRSETVMPQIGSNNNSIVSRQTAHPDDPSRASLYISLMSPLFDQKTGQVDSNFRYLAELPMDEAWIKGDGDATVFVPKEKLQVHMSDEIVEVFGAGQERITGNGAGGLMQGTRTIVKDEDGNLYFALAHRSPIRFNIKTAEFERPPVNIYKWLQKFKPKIEEMPYKKGTVTGVGFDGYNNIFYHQGRIYISTTRYAIFGNNLTLAGMVSIPTADWSDKEKFEKRIHLNAGAWPTVVHPLFDEWVQPQDRLKKLAITIPWAVGNRLCLLAYHFNYFWVMDLEKDGSTRRLVRLETLEGEAIKRFGYPHWAFSNGCLGLRVPVTLEGEKQQRIAFLANGSYAFSAKTPPTSYTQHFWFRTLGPIRGEKTYGRTHVPKSSVGSWLGKAEQAGKGGLTICYDVVGWLKAYRGKCKHLVDMMKGPSLGPGYYLVSLPGEEAQVMGNAEYVSYFFSLFDCSGAAGDPVEKEYLKLDMAETESDIAVGAGLGPMCHTWVHNEEGDDVLYYAGYPGGVCRMTYRRKGKALDRFKVERLKSGMPFKPLDGAPPANIMWMSAMAPGLGDRMLLTGYAKANRGGNAYSGGLMYFNRKEADSLCKLSKMSLAHRTAAMSWRVVMKPQSKVEQEVFLAGNYNGADAMTIPEKDRPVNTRPKVFVYRDAGGERIDDVFGFSLSRAAVSSSVQSLSVSRNQLYLLVFYDNSDLATFDLTDCGFADAVKLGRRCVRFQGRRPLHPMPDGDHMILMYDDKERTSATFIKIGVNAAGKIEVAPFLKCVSGPGKYLTSHAGIPTAFLYDHRNDDGSYDLVLGPDFRRPSTWILVIPDFVPPGKDI